MEPQHYYGDVSPAHVPAAHLQGTDYMATEKARMELRAEALRLAARVIKEGGQPVTMDSAKDLASWLLGEAA
ncbi:hypothetical protein [Streptomyces sp. NPDC059708]|uniref:hypothetical protein n=1 Tax=Streptomyces sp. NPDC059708 TaxID=3346916 RepID=UPI0036826FB8